jgi:hypothetical protein
MPLIFQGAAVAHCLDPTKAHRTHGVATVVCAQVLSPNLVKLVVSDCPKAAPLLALRGLRALAMQASTMDAQQLQQVSMCITPDAERVSQAKSSLSSHKSACSCVGSARLNVKNHQPLLQHVRPNWLLVSSTIKHSNCWCALVERIYRSHPSCCVAPESVFLHLQLPECLPCLQEVQLGYDRGNMDAITAAAPGWPALAGLVKGLDLRVYPGPLPAQTLAHLAHLGSGLTRLAISGELPEAVKRLTLRMKT